MASFINNYFKIKSGTFPVQRLHFILAQINVENSIVKSSFYIFDAIKTKTIDSRKSMPWCAINTSQIEIEHQPKLAHLCCSTKKRSKKKHKLLYYLIVTICCGLHVKKSFHVLILFLFCFETKISSNINTYTMLRKLLKLTLRKMKINQVNKDDIGKYPILAHQRVKCSKKKRLIVESMYAMCIHYTDPYHISSQVYIIMKCFFIFLVLIAFKKRIDVCRYATEARS